jgi:hypothetical protein
MKTIPITKGFLSQRNNPTQNALMMFFVYLSCLPIGWVESEINEDAVNEVRRYFGWDFETGFDVMIKWGISVSCAKSSTSKGRYVAMSKSYHDAKGMIGKGYIYTDKKLGS